MLTKAWRNLIYTKHLDNFHRLISTSVFNETKAKVKTPRKKISLTEREIYKHFSIPERNNALFYPESFFIKKKAKIPDNFYIADSTAAAKIIKEFKKNLPEDKLVMEINPGIGLLTQKLIDETNNDIFLYESEETLFYKVAEIVQNNQNRKISLKQCDFIALWKMGFLDKIDDGNRVEMVFDNVERKDFDDDTTARLFGCIGSVKFFKDLINSVIFQNGFSSVGRIEMYLCVPPSVFLTITCSKDAGYFLYRPTTILFQSLFEYEFISKIDRKCFLPWRSMPANSPKVGKILLHDFDYMYLIRVVPRRNLFKYCLPENLPAFWFFIKQNLSSRKKTVIPSLERWIPGCGPRIIVNAKPKDEPQILHPLSNQLPDYLAPCTSLSTSHFIDNINVFTQFGMLTPTQILTLFNEFVNWPEYESSGFVDVLEKELIKLHTKTEDVDDVLDFENENEDPKETS